MHCKSIYKRHLLCLSLSPFCNAILSLTGRKLSQYEDIDHILAVSLEKKELVACETIIVCKMMCSFIFRNLDEAGKIAQQSLEFFERHDGLGQSYSYLQFINIYRYFYRGLIAFDCFRRTQDQFWEDMGKRSISKFEKWVSECAWNFENKLLLLKAEQHFAMGNITEAKFTYNLAISSARDHRFVHICRNRRLHAMNPG